MTAAAMTNDPRVEKPKACRHCGCTDDRACPGGCYWYEPGVCSACAIKMRLIKL